MQGVSWEEMRLYLALACERRSFAAKATADARRLDRCCEEWGSSNNVNTVVV